MAFIPSSQKKDMKWTKQHASTIFHFLNFQSWLTYIAVQTSQDNWSILNLETIKNSKDTMCLYSVKEEAPWILRHPERKDC